MSQSKFINLSFFSVALLATTLAPGWISEGINGASPLAAEHQLPWLQISSSDRGNNSDQDSQSIREIQLNTVKQSKTELLLADNVELAPQDTVSDPEKARLIRLITLSCFLLFFVPLGIFYPLFLFYKMLLIKPNDSANSNDKDYIFNSDRQFSKSVDQTDADLKVKQNLSQATVSKLQIAFSPPASQLRQELSRVTSMADVNTDHDLVDLMHKTVQVLIEQGHWTHVSHNSQTIALEEARPEFDLISYQERNKFTSKTPSLINYNRNVSSGDGYERNYSYVVVTLILCTSHSNPLFQTINTQEQLVKELVELSKIEKDSVIRFELLWNPQQEDIYISNDQLLIEYEDMTRLL